jgi:hypothetical protein
VPLGAVWAPHERTSNDALPHALPAGLDGKGLMDGGAGAQVDSSALTLSASPVYVELVTDINGDIGVIGTKMADLRAAHEARLRITFGGEEQKEREVQILTSEITRYFNAVGGKLKRLSSFDSGAEEAEIKLRRNIQRGLATRLHDLSTEFRRVAAGWGRASRGRPDAADRRPTLPSVCRPRPQEGPEALRGHDDEDAQGGVAAGAVWRRAGCV